MTCPACGLENIPSARCCDCGQSLVGIVSIKRFARTFTVKHVFEAWGIGAAFVMTEGVFSMFLPLPALWWFPPDVVANFLGWTSGPIPGLLFYSIVLGAVAFWLLDWLYWRPRAQNGTKCDAADQSR